MQIKEKILIIGGDGFIGKALIESFKDEKHKVISTTNKLEKIGDSTIYLNLADSKEKWHLPDTIKVAVICAGITKLEDCEREYEYSHFINVEQTAKLINVLIQKNIFFLFLSSNQVFNGEMMNVSADAKYSPVNNYGKQKVEIEKYICRSSKPYGILRLSKVFDESFLLFQEWISRLKAGQPITVFDDLYIAPLHIENVISVIKSIVNEKQTGIFQFSGGRDITYYEIMQNLCDEYGFNKDLIRRESYKSRINFNLPKYSTLDPELIFRIFGFKRPDTEKTIKKIFLNSLTGKT